MVDGLPASAFAGRATAEQVTAGLDLTGKVVMISGCNSGIGLETMRVLAGCGAHVIGTARTGDKARSACDSVAGHTTPAVLELADFQSVVDCANDISTRVPRIDVLIGNAGMLAGNALEQIGGIERTFAVNHLGHFILVNRLLRLIKAADQGRVVMVSSRAALRAKGIAFDNLSGRYNYSSISAYSQSKLANALFSLELAGRLAGSRATANALHPGVIKTNIARHLPWYFRLPFNFAAGLFMKSLAQGAATACYLASSPELAGVSGCFFADCNPIRSSEAACLYDKSMAKELWQVSEQLTEKYLVREN